jgi:hypothetical protein
MSITFGSTNLNPVMKALIFSILAAGVVACHAGTTILNGVLYGAERGVVGGFGPGQGTFAMLLEGSTLTYYVTTGGHADLTLATPSFRLALPGGDLALPFATGTSILGGGCYFYSIYSPLSIRWDGSGMPATLPLIRPFPLVDCDNIFVASTYAGSFTLDDEQIAEFQGSGFGVSFSARHFGEPGVVPNSPVAISRVGWTDPEFYIVPIPEPNTGVLGSVAFVVSLGRRARKPNKSSRPSRGSADPVALPPVELSGSRAL